MVKKVYVLYLIEETDDEVKDGIYAVFSTREKAEEKGKQLISIPNNGYVSYIVTDYAFYK